MAFQLSAGVFTSEIDLTTIIPAVATTVAAIGGVFMWGPIEERQLITTENELLFYYGPPTINNFETWFSAASFLAYGNALLVSRAGSNTFNAVAGPTINSSSTSTLTIKNTDDYANQGSTVVSANGVNYYAAKWPSSFGNSLRISVCDSATAFSSVLSGNTTLPSTFSFAVGSNTGTVSIAGSNATNGNTYLATILAGLSVNDLVQVGNTTIGTQAMKVTAIANGVTNNSTNVATATISFSTIMTLSSNVTMNTATRFWEFSTVVDQAPGTTAYTALQGGTGDELHVVIVDDGGKFTGTKGEILEAWPNLSRATDAQSDQGGNIYYKDFLNNGSKYVWWATDRGAAPSNTAANMTAASTTTPLNLTFFGGTDGYDETNVPIMSLASAYDQFKNAEDVDVSLLITGKARGGVAGEQLANYLIDNIAEYRKDCVVFLSPANGNVVNNFFAPEQSVVSFKQSVRDSSYAFMDSGYKFMYDRYNDQYHWIPLNGDIAGLCVLTDNLRDPWWSPAGFNRGFIKNIVKLAFNPDQARRDFLYKNGVNPVVTFKGEGTVLYGDKTCLVKPSAFDRINVRRLFIVLEKAIATAAKYTLFEFNDEFTRAQFRNLVEPYLRDIKGRRGIFDYRVVCDETNNTPEVIDSNRFVGDIYIKPARSINFIQLNFVAVRTGVDFNEIVGKF
jgi:hypothetical protein